MNHRHKHLTSLLETPFLTDAGLETDLIFNRHVELPHFASFDLLNRDDGLKILESYYREFLNLAKAHQTGFILETPTWRANRDWGEKLNYSSKELDHINQKAVALMTNLGSEFIGDVPVIISGNIGPRGDGYVIEEIMSVSEAQDYHQAQVASFSASGADLVSGFTINYFEEAAGIVLAAQAFDIPVVISFTVETNGKLPSGDELDDVVKRLDELTEGYALYYMINCAHPSHFIDQLSQHRNESCRNRLRGIRSNASKCSHAELDSAETLDSGNPIELGEDYRRLQQLLPGLSVYGGCCGTDIKHIEQIANACL